uniref:ATP binding cassette subfamily D member 3 n=1 Tax=Astyanax mexicanus TaxID=7994 RepID=A0A8B9H4W0_ASTMX
STKAFELYLFRFIAAMPFISLVNNVLKLGLNQLKLCFRVRLTTHLYNHYLRGFTYYKISNLDNRIGNPDQLLTQDVEKFCNSVVELYSNISKPLLDILIYICKLTSAIGPLGPVSMLGYLLLSGLVLTRLRRPIGKMTVTEQKYEGEYRYINSRLITNSLQQFSPTHYFSLQQFSPTHYLVYSSLAPPILLECVWFCRFTSRITEIQEVLKELNSGRYQRTMISQIKSDGVEKLIPGSGEIVHTDNIIRFEHIPLATPNGDVLIGDLCFEVSSGTNVLVCGPNGCGKSSLFRVLGELWPLFGGRLTKPDRGKLFYVPQRPYMTLGTLRDQVIYPDTPEDQRRRGTSDQVLKEYLDKVQLGHILQREGGWDSVQDWMDLLSGGEKQRMAVGITLFTVSHRSSLWKHHEYYLRMDGRGNYEFKPITTETVKFGS